MSQSIDRATVASMKKAVVRYKRTNLNQAKMRKPQLQSTLRALGVQSVPTVATRKRVKKAAPKRTAAQRLALLYGKEQWQVRYTRYTHDHTHLHSTSLQSCHPLVSCVECQLQCCTTRQCNLLCLQR